MKIKFNKSKIKCVVFDLDGTIYFGNSLASKANEVIIHCRNKYKNIFFATNNSAITRKEVYQKLLKLNVNVLEEEVINSSYLIAQYLFASNYKQVYCLGTDSLKSEIKGFGIIAESQNPQAIVIGYDKEFNLNKLELAINVYNKNCKIIVSNKERTYPRENGIITPGAGAAVSSFEYCVNAKSDILVGKPETKMLEYISQKTGFSADEILMIGDSIESDMNMAKKYGSQGIYIKNGEIEENCEFESINELQELLEIL